MRNVILGTVGGLILGSIGALAYSHFVSDSQLADLQSQLDSANADLAKAKSAKVQMSSETSGVSAQIDELESSNADLRKQLDDAKSAPATTASPAAPVNPATLAAMMMGMMRNGGMQGQQRLFLLKTRLHLTAEQEATVKAAMDADGKARRELGRQMFQNGGKVDPAAVAAANTLDGTLAKVLSPDQMTQYQQVQADEKAARADSMVANQVDSVSPLLQLSDSQRDQLSSALYQVQSTAPDPMSLMGNPNAATIMTTQAQATEAAMSKVLSQDQMALYQQEAQSFNFGGGPRFRGGGGNGRNGGNGGNGGGGQNQDGGGGQNQSAASSAAPAAAAPVQTQVTTTVAPSTDGTSTTQTTTTTDGTTSSTVTASVPATNADGTPATPATTTNAAPAQ